MNHLTSHAVRLITLLLTTTALHAGPLDTTFAAHGGADAWKRQRSLEYRLEMTLGSLRLQDRQRFDLRSRQGLIESDAYRLGSDGGEVWITPSPASLPMPPRFYLWTPFYFLGVPFVFNDPGIKLEDLGRREFEGRSYQAVKVTYAAGTGDAPEDYYIHYADPENALIYDTWQTVDGLTLPESGRFVAWKDGGRAMEPKGTIRFSEVRLSPQAPDATIIHRPADAVIDRSHLPSTQNQKP